MAALGAVTAPLQPRPAGAIDQRLNKKKAPKQTYRPPPAKSAQRSPGVVMGKEVAIKKLLEGAHKVHKVIKFQKQRGKGHAAVDVNWETVAPLPADKNYGR